MFLEKLRWALQLKYIIYYLLFLISVSILPFTGMVCLSEKESKYNTI